MPRDEYALGTGDACGRVGSVALGLVKREVASVSAVLGDGRRIRLRLRALPPSFGDRRAFALVLGRWVAIRRLVATDRDGHREVLAEELAPGALRCGENGAFLIGYAERRGKPRGRLGLTVYYDGVLLCATLARPDPAGGDCTYPPIEDYSNRILVRQAAGRTMVAGVLQREAARAVVRLEGGERRSVAVGDGPYTGRYRGLVRFFALDLPGRRSVVSVRLVDARGRGIITMPGPLFGRLVDRSGLLLRGPGGLALRAGRFRFGFQRGVQVCLALTRQARLGEDSCGFADPEVPDIRAMCSPRRTVVWGILRPGFRGAVIETDNGPVPARVARLPRSWRPHRSHVFLAEVPGSSAPRALVLEGRRRTFRRRLQVPPAARQCGYETIFTLQLPGR
jgi:hypothetical protein